MMGRREIGVQFEAEAAAKLFEMQREIDRLQAESDEMQSEIEDLVERLAASESREAGISSRVDELEGELSKQVTALRSCKPLSPNE